MEYMYMYARVQIYEIHARIQKVLSEGVQLWQLFLADEGKKAQNTSLSGSSSARQRNAI